jgi:hypothetical protein
VSSCGRCALGQRASGNSDLLAAGISAFKAAPLPAPRQRDRHRRPVSTRPCCCPPAAATGPRTSSPHQFFTGTDPRAPPAPRQQALGGCLTAADDSQGSALHWKSPQFRQPRGRALRSLRNYFVQTAVTITLTVPSPGVSLTDRPAHPSPAGCDSWIASPEGVTAPPPSSAVPDGHCATASGLESN